MRFTRIAFAATLALGAPPSIMSSPLYDCDEFQPPWAPAKYDSMPGDPSEGGFTYANFPYQEAEPNHLICEYDPSNYESFKYMHTHWSQFFPTKILPRGEGPIHTIPKVKDIDSHMENINSLKTKYSFNPEVGEDTLLNALTGYKVDALLAIHKGEIYYEGYESVHNSAMTHHVLWSMTKSYTGLIAAMLALEGKLDPEKKVTEYLPELSEPKNIDAIKYGKVDEETGKRDNTHYDEMTVRNLMDMSIETSFSEAEHVSFMNGVGALYNSKKNDDGVGFRNFPLFFGRNDTEIQHGHKFEYRSMIT